jgi:hypothetical protein
MELMVQMVMMALTEHRVPKEFKEIKVQSD